MCSGISAVVLPQDFKATAEVADALGRYLSLQPEESRSVMLCNAEAHVLHALRQSLRGSLPDEQIVELNNAFIARAKQELERLITIRGLC